MPVLPIFRQGPANWPDMRLHAEVPLVALLGLMHLGVTLAATVLGRAERGDQRGIDHRAALEQQALVGQHCVDRSQDLRRQLKRFQLVAKAQDAHAVRHPLGAAQAAEVPVQGGVEQGLFHGDVAQSEPLLKRVNSQHRLQLKRRAPDLGPRCMRLDQRRQLPPGHCQVHLLQKRRLARTPRTQVQAQVLLLHAVIVPSATGSCHSGLPEVLNTIPRFF